jgi:hypothetical protein
VPEADRDTRTASVDAYRQRLAGLRAVGQQLRSTFAVPPGTPADYQSLDRWQRECGATLHQLSGGNKAHWLSRAFSRALLVPVAAAGSADVVTIIDRLIDVLDSAGRSLIEAKALPTSDLGGLAEPPPRARFTSIDNAALRSSLERAYLEGHEALTRGEVALALMTFCSILETVITDALERQVPSRLAPHGAPAEPIVTWPFATRIATAERVGLISRGCARLPRIAREYRERVDTAGGSVAGEVVSARDAKLTSDVLHVILRDLAPGR